MGKLLYVTNVSLDGYIEDAAGSFDFSEPGDDVFVFITDLLRGVDTHLYGRRLYETMAVWETDPGLADESALTREFARVWQNADKVVFSTTLGAASTARTRVEHRFDPAAVLDMKAAAEGDLIVGGAELASHAAAARVVDEYHLFIAPVVLGGGKPALSTDARVRLELLEERRFASGTVYVRYRIA